MNSPRSSTPAPERDAQLLGLGQPCSHQQCSLIDFLPFKCQHCQLSFCQNHFKVEAHYCTQYDEMKHNRVAPDCPMCKMPVAIKPGQDPNVRMEEHFERECSAMTGKEASKSMPTCTRGNCKKVLYTPIKCDKCRKDFCASHRFPKDHKCLTASVSAKAPTTSRFGASQPLVARFSSSSGTTSAVKKATLNTTAASSSSSSISNGSSALSVPSPFNKTDRRARAERISRVKAMQERARKGLLSEREKAILAEEEAELERTGNDCIVM